MKNRCLGVIVLLLMQFFVVRAVSFDDRTGPDQGVSIVQNIPMMVGNWKGTDHPLDPVVYDILETRSIIHRSYVNDNGKSVFLSIVYYAETKVDFHAPEGCLGGQGIKTTKSPVEIHVTNADGTPQTLTVNKLIQQEIGFNNTDLVYYFYKSGPFMGRSYIKLRLNLILNKFRDAKKSGSLIRVSTRIHPDSDQTDGGEVVLAEFINQLQPFLLRYL